ncbi:MAG TPA: hypothetical protein VNU01_07535 [Egibacteraceae bacterium]|nr:hypothetical protein [Egibacteraceae bacterium]
MQELHCSTCELPIVERAGDPGYWTDSDGWFVSEFPSLHAHRPADDIALLVELRDEDSLSAHR